MSQKYQLNKYLLSVCDHRHGDQLFSFSLIIYFSSTAVSTQQQVYFSLSKKINYKSYLYTNNLSISQLSKKIHWISCYCSYWYTTSTYMYHIFRYYFHASPLDFSPDYDRRHERKHCKTLIIKTIELRNFHIRWLDNFQGIFFHSDVF